LLSPAVPATARFPVAEAVAERGLALPLYIGMRSAQLDRVCDTLAEVIA
jgi:dTDP-4-amino-4,6-dideoxygalactose transaminase